MPEFFVEAVTAIDYRIQNLTERLHLDPITQEVRNAFDQCRRQNICRVGPNRCEWFIRDSGTLCQVCQRKCSSANRNDHGVAAEKYDDANTRSSATPVHRMVQVSRCAAGCGERLGLG